MAEPTSAEYNYIGLQFYASDKTGEYDIIIAKHPDMTLMDLDHIISHLHKSIKQSLENEAFTKFSGRLPKLK